MNLIKKLFRKKEQKQCAISGVSKRFIPKGWYVHEAGQNPLHMLWFVVFINFDDVANNIENPRHFVAEECDSFEEALQECAKNVANTYLELDRILDLLAPLGWVFEYYLDAEPYNLSPMNFAWWMQSDNVVECEGGYLTQCTQYAKVFTSEEIKQYYQKEFGSIK